MAVAKVLIADDHPEIRRLWTVNLAARDFDISSVADGRECLRQIEEEEPDVILLDLNMPVLSGWDVLDALRERPGGTRPSVIVVSGLAGAEIEAKARRMGAVGVLFKPFGVDQLLRAIELALTGGGS